ncbi:LA_2272 family surface repeat-containing protein [Flavobacterium sp. NRK1]|uniref:LA_2272 family surface repeat-containing protein n=1 Tax=Flavobacterium sp. NRK1 TaxID=2954929 RepID=UPI0020934847|nr:hypothetical protein [Flavobacterium sp. NRK1]MCO6148222.1 hypothetical protein [Flavobacterium sp. NRK1]
MKKILTIFVLSAIFVCFSQQKDSLHSQIFSLTPLAKNVNKVNGVTFGIGQLFDREKEAAINGLSLEINPVLPLALLFLDPSKVINNKVKLKHNGVQIAVGGFSGDVAHNGLNISVYTITNSANGLGIIGIYNVSKTLNGLHVAGLTNSTDNAIGMLISPINSADILKGVQIGAYNKSLSVIGIQIGLYNSTSRIKGLQIGLWNTNGKRSLPFINW